jgi:hypothetical protein
MEECRCCGLKTHGSVETIEGNTVMHFPNICPRCFAKEESLVRFTINDK